MFKRLTTALLGFVLVGLGTAAYGQSPDAPEQPAPSVAQTPKPPKITYSSVNPDGPYIAITFDDGPSTANTPRLLDILAKRGVKATFFLVGQCVATAPELVKREVEEGHEIANHSWSHPILAKKSDEGVRSELQKTHDAILQACGQAPTLMRPPYGALTERQRTWVNQQFGYKIILWDVDPLDWKRPGAGVIAQRIIQETRPGSIILAHDIHAQTIDAVPQILDALLAKGFKFVTVSQLLAMDNPKKAAPAPSAQPSKTTNRTRAKHKKEQELARQ